METTKRLKYTAFLLGIIGFIPALFLWAQTLGLGMKTDEEKAHVSLLIVDGINIFEEMATRYSFISACFLLSVVFLLIHNKIFLKVASVILLAFIATQCRLLIIFKMDILKGKWVYSSWLEITYYMDFGFLALTIILLILHLYLIRLGYRSSVYENP